MELFNLSSEKVALLLILSVLLFGERLPEVARTVAKLSRKLVEVRREFQDMLRLDP
jgi:Sec-independent protein translocase protein TatA